MTEPKKPESSIYIKPSNGRHSLVAPVKTGEQIELPRGYWRGCDVDGSPRDPSLPWYWWKRGY